MQKLQFKTVWTKNYQNEDVFDDKAFWENIILFRQNIEYCVDNYIVSMEGSTQTSKQFKN